MESALATSQKWAIGRFAYGFWQSREHYATQSELLTAAQEFRRRQIPVDVIVQDRA